MNEKESGPGKSFPGKVVRLAAKADVARFPHPPVRCNSLGNTQDQGWSWCTQLWAQGEAAQESSSFQGETAPSSGLTLSLSTWSFNFSMPQSSHLQNRWNSISLRVAGVKEDRTEQPLMAEDRHSSFKNLRFSQWWRFH